MKIFVAYRFTGEDLNELETVLGKIKGILESKGAEIFCSLFLEEHFKKEGFSYREIYDYCSQQLKKHNLILFFIKSEEKSKGMMFELEEAIKNNKRIILVIQKNLNFHEFREVAHKTIEFDGLLNLYDLLSETELHL